VGEVIAHGQRDHMQKRSYLMHSLCCPWGERQNLEDIGEVAAHGVKKSTTYQRG